MDVTGNIHIDHHVDGMENDTIRYPHDSEREYLHRIDEEVVDSAASYVKSNGPDLTWVYLEFTDDMGHKYGDHEKFYKAIETMDMQVERIWEAIQYRQKNFNEDWVIYITTDHGRDAKTGKGHGGQSDRERDTWIVTNAKGLNDYFFKNRPGIVDIMPSIASFLNLPISRAQRMEIDGVPLTGKLSVTNPTAILGEGKIKLSWKAMQNKGSVKIWLTTTNNFKTGGKDEYKLVAKVLLSKQEYEIDISGISGTFYKIVLEGADNFCNTWVRN